MTVKNKDKMLFKWYAPSTTKSYNLNDDGTLTIEGTASTTNKDLEGDVILQSAIDSMKIQLSLKRMFFSKKFKTKRSYIFFHTKFFFNTPISVVL